MRSKSFRSNSMLFFPSIDDLRFAACRASMSRSPPACRKRERKRCGERRRKGRKEFDDGDDALFFSIDGRRRLSERKLPVFSSDVLLSRFSAAVTRKAHEGARDSLGRGTRERAKKRERERETKLD